MMRAGAYLATAWLLAAAMARADSADPQIRPYLAAAIADPARPSEQVRLDPARKPAEVIAFAGLKPGDRIVDFMSGNGYFTRLFSGVVGPQGHVYAFLPAEELRNCTQGETAGTKALEQDAHYRNVTVLVAAADRFAVPESLDMAWTAQNYHDLHDTFMAPSDVITVDRAIFHALKPGGILIVIDHVAAPGSGLRDTQTLHRIDPEVIRTEVTSVGFIFLAQSEALRNAADSHALPVFDPAVRHATDQVIFKFRKPGGASWR